jgi:hypothetical protein
MAPDDRDRTFEKALASHLRSGATHPDCLDPELLAAYHERLLAPEHMMSCKQHIASCARCQEVLAQLEATDDLLIETDQQEVIPENVLTMPSPQEAPELVPALSESAPAGPVAVPPRSARVAQSAWRSKTLHGAKWRWLAPAGLLAAGLLIWISFHETAPSPFKVAKNTSPAAPAPESKPSLPLSPAQRSSDTGTLKKERAEEVETSKPAGYSAAGPATRADERAATRQIAQTAEPKQNEREKALQSAMLDQKKSAASSSGTIAAPSAPVILAEPRTRAERDADQSNLSAAATSPGDAGAAQDKLMRKESPSASTPTVPAIQKDDAVRAVAANAPPSQTDNSLTAEIAGGRQTSKKAKSEIAAGTAQLQSAIAPEAETAPAMRVAKARTYATVTAPNSTAMWRFASAGLVEHSTDSGSTWAIQPTGVVADLLSASAPSAKICWIVGRNATILRTTDAGSHWTQVSAPTTADITTVFAVNAQQATITTSARESYLTKDAAESWSRVPDP